MGGYERCRDHDAKTREDAVGDAQPSTPPRCQQRLSAVPKLSPRFAAMVVLMTSRGWPSVVTSNMLRPAPSSRLENLTGFFSNLAGGAMTEAMAAGMTWRR